MTEVYKDIFKLLPGCYLIVFPNPPEFTIFDANLAYLNVSQSNESIIGKPLFEVFPDNFNDPSSTGVANLSSSLLRVCETKEKHKMPVQRYDILNSMKNGFLEKYWKPVNIPILNDKNEIEFIIHSVEDITKQYKINAEIKKNREGIQRQISDAVATSQEIERMEISRELHDNILQLLNTSRMYLGRALLTHHPEEKYIHSGMELVNSAIEQLRKLSLALIESSVEEENMTTLIEGILSHVLSLSKININKTIDLPDESLIESKVKLAVIRIIQEQLGNVVKHANADNLWIHLHFQNNQLQLVIKDDGVGFNPKEKPKGLGLQNIKARVAMMNGEIFIQSSPGDGCHIEIKLPV